MGIQEMESGIIAEAGKKAATLLEEARRKKEERLAEAARRIEMEKETIREKFDESALELERKELASARIRAKKELLGKKKEIIDTVYDRFFAELDKSVSREELLALLFEAGKSQLKGVDRVYVNKKDMEAAKKLGVEVKIKNIEGGIVLEKGAESVDLSLDVLESMAKSKTLKKVSGALFGEG